MTSRCLGDTPAPTEEENMPVFKFKGVDFIEFDSLLTDDERLVRDTARRFIEENLIPIIEECNREGRFPRELVSPWPISASLAPA